MKAKRFLAAAIAAMMSMSGMAAVVHAEKTEIFSYNFDNIASFNDIEGFNTSNHLAIDNEVSLTDEVTYDGAGKSVKLSSAYANVKTLPTGANSSGLLEASVNICYTTLPAGQSDNVLQLKLNTGWTALNSVSSTTLKANEWYNYTVRVDTTSGTVQYFLDGSKISEKTIAGMTSVTVIQTQHSNSSGSTFYLDDFSFRKYTDAFPESVDTGEFVKKVNYAVSYDNDADMSAYQSGSAPMYFYSGLGELDETVKKGESGKSVKFASTQKAKDTLARRANTQDGCIEGSADFYWTSFESGGRPDQIFWVNFSATNHGGARALKIAADGDMRNTSYASLGRGRLRLNKWYHISFRSNPAEKKLTWFVDGKAVLEESTDGKEIVAFGLVQQNGSNSLFYVDNWTLKTYSGFGEAEWAPNDIYDYDFENVTSIPQSAGMLYTEAAGAPRLSIADTLAFGGSGKAVKVDGSTEIPDGSLSKLISYLNPAKTGKLEASVDCYWEKLSDAASDTTDGYENFLTVRMGTNSSGGNVFSKSLTVTGNGSIGDNRRAPIAGAQRIRANKWYTFTVRYDTNARTLSWYVNGTKLLEETVTETVTAPQFAQVQFQQHANSNAVLYLDNWRLSAYSDYPEIEVSEPVDSRTAYAEAAGIKKNGAWAIASELSEGDAVKIAVEAAGDTAYDVIAAAYDSDGTLTDVKLIARNQTGSGEYDYTIGTVGEETPIKLLVWNIADVRALGAAMTYNLRAE